MVAQVKAGLPRVKCRKKAGFSRRGSLAGREGSFSTAMKAIIEASSRGSEEVCDVNISLSRTLRAKLKTENMFLCWIFGRKLV